MKSKAVWVAKAETIKEAIAANQRNSERLMKSVLKTGADTRADLVKQNGEILLHLKSLHEKQLKSVVRSF